MALSKEIVSLADNLQEMPRNMRLFSISLRALYAEKSVSSDTDTGRKFNKLRDNTRRNAVVYVKGVLPLSTTLVGSVREFFERYIELSYNGWITNFSDILEEVKGYKQCCQEVAEIHQELVEPLKSRREEAKIIVDDMEDLSAEYERKKNEMMKSAKFKLGFGLGLLFIPVVGVIAGPLLLTGATSDAKTSVVSGFQYQQTEAAALVVNDTMIPALEAFVHGLISVAGFFDVVENELTSFQSQEEDQMESEKRAHFNVVKERANEIVKYCQECFAIVPDVKSDFETISHEETDNFFVNEWLAQKKEDILKKYHGSSITGHLHKIIYHLSIDEVGKLFPKQ